MHKTLMHINKETSVVLQWQAAAPAYAVFPCERQQMEGVAVTVVP